jgi:hypothetical protein
LCHRRLPAGATSSSHRTGLSILLLF